MQEFIVNFSEPREKNLLLSKLRDLQGKFRINLVEHRARRSDRQNRYYWPCFVQPFAEWIRETGEECTDLEAHKMLATKFLTVTKMDPKTGEILGDYVRSTTELSTKEFNLYLEKCDAMLATLGIQVPEPRIYLEHEHDNKPIHA